MLMTRRLAALCAVVSGLSCAMLANAPEANAQTVKYKSVTTVAPQSGRRVEGSAKVERQLHNVPADNIGAPMKPSEKIIEGQDKIPGAIGAPGA